MGPRSIDRGIQVAGSAVVSAATLQWGRDQLIAELMAVGVFGSNIVSASMGPRSIDRGIAGGNLHCSSIPQASMGPRSIDRGIMADLVAANLNFKASMGPRSIDRGISGSP